MEFVKMHGTGNDFIFLLDFYIEIILSFLDFWIIYLVFKFLNF